MATGETHPAAVMAAPVIHTRRIGWVRGIRERFFGQQSEDLKIEDHSRGLLRVGRALAPVLIIIFSFAFAFYLTGNLTKVLFADVNPAGIVLNLKGWIIFAATIVGIVALDITMIIAFTQVRDALSRGQGPGEWWFSAVWGGAVCLIEGGVFFLILQSSEPDASIAQLVLDAARSIMTPGAAIFLTIVPDRSLTPDEAIRFVFRKFAAATIALLEDIQIAGMASFDDMMSIFFKLASFRAGDDPKEFLDTITEELAALAPSAMQAKIIALREVAQDAEQRIALAEQDASALVERVRGEFAGRLSTLITNGMYGAVMNGAWPDDLLAIAPALATLPVPGASRGGPVRVTAAERKAINPGTKVGEMRIAARALGLEDGDFVASYKNGKGATVKPKALWVRGAVIARLADPARPVTADEATRIAREVGDGLKEGASYIAPFVAVLKELASRNKLHPDLVRFVSDATGDTEDAE